MDMPVRNSLGYPYYPYYPVVLDLLRSRLADSVLDAPCGLGWLGDMLPAASGRQVDIDGVGLWEFPQSGGGYRQLSEHDLETPLTVATSYDAVVCCEAIHLLTNPGVLMQSFHRALRPGGTLIITTPNTWYFRSRLQFLLRGFHSGFRPMVGRQRGEDYITYFPWSFPQLHLLLKHYGFTDITLHDVDEHKPKRMVEHVLAVPSRLYYGRRLRQAQDEESRRYWKQAGSDQSVHGRWLVMSARRPVADTAGG
ncbi:class I SAM-dependent methyltransferase [Achromobacter sp. SD115]|uniref:class I SAM-dependent methyltransferase n=1 Tax=Achromobacter sp. SD115 TaxID=2782011 RepID=UPI001A964DF7|nr:class I SAM-dependent methyltransferase [Achromobacter sp. SD115]MBO1017497.1 class I SAM-dependent methyltransferase [Achromobacter sp. SD115]